MSEIGKILSESVGQFQREMRMVDLLRTIERFLKETGMPATRFGRDAVRDPRLVLDMRQGRQAGRRMRSRVEHFMNIWRNGGAR